MKWKLELVKPLNCEDPEKTHVYRASRMRAKTDHWDEQRGNGCKIGELKPLNLDGVIMDG